MIKNKFQYHVISALYALPVMLSLSFLAMLLRNYGIIGDFLLGAVIGLSSYLAFTVQDSIKKLLIKEIVADAAALVLKQELELVTKLNKQEVDNEQSS